MKSSTAVRALLRRWPGVELCEDDGVWLLRHDESDDYLIHLRYEHPKHGMLYAAVITRYAPSAIVENIAEAADALVRLK